MALRRDDAAGNAAPIIERTDLDGTFVARLIRVVDLGIQPRDAYEGKPKDPCSQILVYFELPTEFEEDQEGNQRTRMVWEYLNLFRNAQRGKEIEWYAALDPSAEHGGDWSKLIGTPCTLGIKTNKVTKNGQQRKYFNIKSVAGPMSGMDTPDGMLERYSFDLDAPDQAVFESMPNHIQTMISNRLTLEDMARTYEEHKAEREAQPQGPGYQPAGVESAPTGATVEAAPAPWEKGNE